jgi:hypothetical protein
MSDAAVFESMTNGVASRGQQKHAARPACLAAEPLIRVPLAGIVARVSLEIGAETAV